MRWYGRPEGDKQLLPRAPRVDVWEKAGHPRLVEQHAFIDEIKPLISPSQVDGPSALRLDVGLPDGTDLVSAGDLDNYLKPLVHRLPVPGLVSVWGRKYHSEHSFVRVEPAREVSPPSTGMLVVRPTVSHDKTSEYRAQIHAALGDVAELPPDLSVKLELAFVVGKAWNWVNLWKPTIDSLDPLLGRGPTRPGQPWNPLDGRITELGMHVTVDPGARHVTIGIAASPA